MAEVRVIREGHWRWIQRPTLVDVTCTTTLVLSGSSRILVDLPNVGEEKELIEALAAQGLKPDDIDIVVLTHFHPDHSGCSSLFTRAEFVAHHTRWRGARHERWPQERLDLTDDVYVLKTPGHTDSDCSVIAKGSQGVVAVAGDLWVRSPSDPRILVVHDKAALEGSRRHLIGLAQWIIPGHGPIGTSSEAIAGIPETK